MPIIEIKVLENEFSEDDKKKFIADITDVLVTFFGENLRNHIWVIVQELKSGNLGIGGRLLDQRT